MRRTARLLRAPHLRSLLIQALVPRYIYTWTFHTTISCHNWEPAVSLRLGGSFLDSWMFAMNGSVFHAAFNGEAQCIMGLMEPSLHRHRRHTKRSPSTAERTTTPLRRSLLSPLPQPLMHRAQHRAATIHYCMTAHSWDPVRWPYSPRTSRSGPHSQVPPALPGLSREASLCFVYPVEAPPQLNHSHYPLVPQDTVHQSVSAATSRPLMT